MDWEEYPGPAKHIDITAYVNTSKFEAMVDRVKTVNQAEKLIDICHEELAKMLISIHRRIAPFK